MTPLAMKLFSFLRSRRAGVMLLSVIAGLGAGHLLRGGALPLAWSGDLTGVESNDPTARDKGEKDRQNLKNRGGGKGGMVLDLKALPAQLALATRVERSLILAAAVEKASLDQLPELMRLAGDDPQAGDLIATRWAQKSPEHLWRSMVKVFRPGDSGGTAFGMSFDSLSTLVLQNWVDRDSTAVAALLDKGDGVPNLSRLRYKGMGLLFAKDPEAALRLAGDWSGDMLGFEEKDLRKWIQVNPARAAKVLSGCGGSFALSQVAGKVGALWADKDPEGALTFAIGELTGGLSLAMSKGVVKSWADKEPAAAAAWIAANAKDRLRSELSADLVAIWQKSNPVAAMEWSEGNLRGEAKANAVYSLVLEEASKDVDAARERTAAMEPGSLKNKITGRLALIESQSSGLQSAVDWLFTLRDPAARRSGLLEAVRGAYTQDPKQAADIAAGPLAEQLPVEFTETVAGNFANLRPKEAMEWVETLPADRQNEARAEAWRIWLSNRPQEAVEWFGRTALATTGRAALMEAASSWLAGQTPAIADALISNLRPEDLPVVRAAVEKLSWVEAGKKAALLKSLER